MASPHLTRRKVFADEEAIETERIDELALNAVQRRKVFADEGAIETEP